MMPDSVLAACLVFDLGVVGNWGWRGRKPFGFGNVELICFDYHPAVIHPLGPTNTRRLFTG